MARHTLIAQINGSCTLIIEQTKESTDPETAAWKWKGQGRCEPYLPNPAPGSGATAEAEHSPAPHAAPCPSPSGFVTPAPFALSHL